MADTDKIAVSPDLIQLLPRKTAVELGVLPLRMERQTVVIGAARDSGQGLVTDLSFLLGRQVRIQHLPETELRAAIQKYYGASQEDMHLPDGKRQGDTLFVSVSDDADGSGNLPIGPELAGDESTVSLVNRIISEAISLGASDIHIEPYERVFRIRYRLDGVLHEIDHPPVSQSKSLISRLKIMADLDIAEKRRPQDGRIRVKKGERVIDIRVSSLPTDFGEKIVLRILDKSQLQLDLARLGFEEAGLRVFRKTVKLPYGMILVTGPTGSGKTTTLYAALSFINRPEVNITTIEDPIEYNLEGINQTHVRSDIGLTFAAALRSILRQDPNVIMVGEIRDGETAEIAIRAALTGHLVFSTLHTNDAPSAITRLIDMGVEPFLVASSVKMILAQRLLRLLCPECRRPVQISEDVADELSFSGGQRKKTYYQPQGCTLCNKTGYKGRAAVYEVLPLQNGISDLIAKGVSASELRAKAQCIGMLTLRDAALLKAEKGETSLDEVIRETVG